MQKSKVLAFLLFGIFIMQISAFAVTQTRLVVGKIKAADQAAKTLTVIPLMGVEGNKELTLSTDEKTEFIGAKDLSELAVDDTVYAAYHHDPETNTSLAVSIQKKLVGPKPPEGAKPEEAKKE